MSAPKPPYQPAKDLIKNLRAGAVNTGTLNEYVPEINEEAALVLEAADNMAAAIATGTPSPKEALRKYHMAICKALSLEGVDCHE